MIQYIYFVKCPNCDDEPFDFFDEAKEFAIGCLGSKPIITQTEVCRNDFGECTESSDLGTVWSWEDMMNDCETEEEPAKSVFTKADLVPDEEDDDPEFTALDNSVEVEEPIVCTLDNGEELDAAFKKLDEAVPDTIATDSRGNYLVKADSGHGYTAFSKDRVCLGGISSEDDEDAKSKFLAGKLDEDLVAQDDALVEAAGIDIATIDVGSINPQKKDWDRAEGLQFRGSTFKGSGAPWNSEASKMAKLIKDPLKLVRRAMAVYATYGEGFSGDDDAWGPFADALWNMGFSNQQVKDLKAKADSFDESYDRPDADIKSLVETMEESEDTVECKCCQELFPKDSCNYLEGIGYACMDCEINDPVRCTWCEEVFPKSECRQEADLGYLCSRCAAAIKSRGESLIFLESLLESPRQIEAPDMTNIDSIVDLFKAAFEAGAFEKLNGITGRENAKSFAISGPDKGRLIGYMDKQPGFRREDNTESGIYSAEFVSDTLDIEIFDTFVNIYKIPTNESLVEDADNIEDEDFMDPSVAELFTKKFDLCPECGEESFDAEYAYCHKCGLGIPETAEEA